LDGVERAIRTALEKGNAEDRAFREKVYRQAFAALERAISANPGITEEAVAERRAGLERKISLIESEFMPALGGVSRGEPAASPAPEIGIDMADDPARRAPDVAPRSEPRSKAAPGNSRRDPDFEMGEPPRSAPVVGAGRESVVPRRRRRRLAMILSIVTVIVALGIGLWWVYGTGLIGPRDDGSVPNPPQVLKDEDFTPGESQAPKGTEEADADVQWIDIFDASDPTRVRTPAGASAEMLREEDRNFMRIRSGASGVMFDVGQGILEQIAGRKVIFSLLARAEGNTPTQISVECDFGALGNCGRRRYDVTIEQGEYLFDVEMPRAQPAGAGTISILTQLGGEPRSVDVFGLRVSIAEE
jgi:hypothetical protein